MRGSSPTPLLTRPRIRSHTNTDEGIQVWSLIKKPQPHSVVNIWIRSIAFDLNIIPGPGPDSHLINRQVVQKDQEATHRTK
ncbi:hypothetical protein A0H81_05287 [Grifola frondosa]|uniref:Uncharacterized protein n=1 Tax=Grifola frondosa TaxID=5627 RepID=A0A1C7ME00_GRIFR|nr:hypothetical protein A0H81_05287 [Grifola frondosa]